MKINLLALAIALLASPLMAMETPKLICFGTEPFWGLKTKTSTLSINHFGSQEDVYKITSVTPAVGTQVGWATLIKAEGKNGALSLIAKKEACNDGMSDEVYAYSAFVQTSEVLLIGCCNDN